MVPLSPPRRTTNVPKDQPARPLSLTQQPWNSYQVTLWSQRVKHSPNSIWNQLSPMHVELRCPHSRMSYTWERKHISDETLAVVNLLEVPSQLTGAADIVAIRFPVTYLPAQEPPLVNCSMLQLGDVSASRKELKDTTDSMDVGTTAVIKIQHIRDELSQHCERMAPAPIKLAAACAAFRHCNEPRCDNKRGLNHPAVENNMGQVILEV